jgi:hypothetical protein
MTGQLEFNYTDRAFRRVHYAAFNDRTGSCSIPVFCYAGMGNECCAEPVGDAAVNGAAASGVFPVSEKDAAAAVAAGAGAAWLW